MQQKAAVDAEVANWIFLSMKTASHGWKISFSSSLWTLYFILLLIKLNYLFYALTAVSPP